VNKKAIIINVVILALLIGFVVISITFYYLLPVAESGMDCLQEAIEELMKIIRR